MSNRGRASRSSSASGIKDIGVFVENYRSLLDKLFPVLAVWDIVLYVARWENYLLTLAAILTLSILFYFPTVLFSLLTLAAIFVMGVGRYHGQTKEIIALRKLPAVELLDPDQPALKQQHSEQEHMHKSRLEFREILSNAESFILTACKVVDYLHSVYLWKSPEVSLCVTVLLCVLLVLLCTVSLHSIGAAIPIVVLCTNKYFFLRSIDLWKRLLIWLKQRLHKRWRRRGSTQSSSESRVLGDQEKEESETVVTAGKPSTLQMLEEQGGDHESENSETMTPDLRRRVGVPQLSTDLTSASAREGGEATTRLGDCTVSETDTSVPSSGGLGTSQPSRKDGKSTALQPELCSTCQTSFFFKRKHDCNLCGQTFCGSCTVKVKRAALGVTSPTASDNSVRVCLNCKARLDDYVCSKE